MDAAIDHQPLNLMKHRRVRRVAVAAIGAARRDDPHWRTVGDHLADLHRRGVRAQQHPVPVLILAVEIEGVVHRARRMGFGNVEGGEIVPVVLDLRPGGDRKTEIGENLRQFVHHLADRMDRPAVARRRGERQVEAFARQLPIERGVFERRLAFGQRRGNRLAQLVDRAAFALALFGRHRAERLEQGRDAALLAERGHAYRLDRCDVVGRRDIGDQVRLQGCDIGHVCVR